LIGFSIRLVDQSRGKYISSGVAIIPEMGLPVSYRQVGSQTYYNGYGNAKVVNGFACTPCALTDAAYRHYHFGRALVDHANCIPRRESLTVAGRVNVYD
jgi:hypothetical protein